MAASALSPASSLSTLPPGYGRHSAVAWLCHVARPPKFIFLIWPTNFIPVAICLNKEPGECSRAWGYSMKISSCFSEQLCRGTALSQGKGFQSQMKTFLHGIPSVIESLHNIKHLWWQRCVVFKMSICFPWRTASYRCWFTALPSVEWRA